MRTGREIHLVKNPDGWWTARDEDLGVSTEGATRADALAAIDDVVAAITGDGGHEPTDEEIRALGVDPETARSQSDDLPEVLQ